MGKIPKIGVSWKTRPHEQPPGARLHLSGIFLFFALTFSAAAAPPFTDARLRALEAKGNEALLLSWSPHMPLSVRGLDEAFARAKISGTVLVPLLDPGSNLELARRIAREKGWLASALAVNESSELLERGFRVHAPSYQYLRQGKLLGPALPGYKTEKQLSRFRESLEK